MPVSEPPVIDPPVSTTSSFNPLGENWFELDKSKSDLDNVMNFLEQLPRKLKLFFQEPFFNSVFEKASRDHDMDKSLFFSGLEEASVTLRNELELMQAKFASSNPEEKEKAIAAANHTLKTIGFTGQSLILKATVLNALAEKTKKPFGRRVRDFFWNPIARRVRDFAEFLNSIMGSLFSFVPGVEALTEIKDVGEATIALTEE